MARPFGIPVFVSPYWFLIAGVFIVIYANDLSTTLHGNIRYVVAAAFVVLLYLSVLGFLGVSFYFYSRNVRIERQLTEVVRQMALRDARRGESAPARDE